MSAFFTVTLTSIGFILGTFYKVSDWIAHGFGSQRLQQICPTNDLGDESFSSLEMWDIRERFTAIADCPRCDTLDLHPIKDVLPHSCRRECNNCAYVWRQV